MVHAAQRGVRQCILLPEQQDVERIARAVLRELGTGGVDVKVVPEGRADSWRVSVEGASPATLVVRAGRGTTVQFIRQQIFEQLQRK